MSAFLAEKNSEEAVMSMFINMQVANKKLKQTGSLRHPMQVK